MKKKNRQIIIGIGLIILSAVFYTLHYFIFRDGHHIFLYMIGDIAFVFIEVLMVSVIIHRVLEVREKKCIMEKMNMVVGVFFSQFGTELLRMLTEFHVEPQNLQEELLVKVNWKEEKFKALAKEMADFDCEMDSRKSDMETMKDYLRNKTEFLLGMLENPILLEKDSFTDMLWAVFHLADELCSREEVKDIPATDFDHLSGDMKRAYKALIIEWIQYLEHLKNKYPYLLSLAVRKNPFKKDADIIVRV